MEVKDQIRTSAALTIVDEIRSLLAVYEITGKIPLERIEGIKERLRMLQEMLT